VHNHPQSCNPTYRLRFTPDVRCEEYPVGTSQPGGLGDLQWCWRAERKYVDAIGLPELPVSELDTITPVVAVITEVDELPLKRDQD